MQKCLEDCRMALGDDMELMVDCYLSWDIEFASRLGGAHGRLRCEVV